jgi:hypothetical protein
VSLTHELDTLEDHLLPILRKGQKDRAGEKIIPVQLLERIPSDDTQRLLDGARYCEDLRSTRGGRTCPILGPEHHAIRDSVCPLDRGALVPDGWARIHR